MEMSGQEGLQRSLKPYSLVKLADEFVRSDAVYGKGSGPTYSRWTAVLAWLPEARKYGLMGDYTELYAKMASSRDSNRVFAAMELAELQWYFYNLLHQSALTFSHTTHATCLLLRHWHVRLDHTFFTIVDEKRREEVLVKNGVDPIRGSYH